MIGFDTNILLRAMIGDDPYQSKLAREKLLSLKEEKSGYVSIGVMLELYWVLERGYKLSRSVIADSLEKLVKVASLEFEHFDQIILSLELYKSGKADFSDLLIAHINAANGCTHTVTFDKRAAKNAPGMELLS